MLGLEHTGVRALPFGLCDCAALEVPLPSPSVFPRRPFCWLQDCADPRPVAYLPGRASRRCPVRGGCQRAILCELSA